MTCKECRWWRRGHFQTAANGSIEIIEDNEPFGMCLHQKIQSDYVIGWTHQPHKRTQDSIEAECDECRAILHVGPDFGCIHFEAK